MKLDKVCNVLAVVISVLIAIGFIGYTFAIDKIIQRQDNLEERIKQLEIDYKIYELDLTQLQENQDVQFGR